MPAHVPPVADEKDGLVAYLAQQLDAFRSVAFGSPTTRPAPPRRRARCRWGRWSSTPPAWSRGWMARVTAAPEPPPADDRPFEQRVADYQDEFVMREDETLDGILQRFDEQAELTLRQLRDADLDTPVPVPTDAPWFPDDVTHWSVRWVALHLLEEPRAARRSRRHHPGGRRRRDHVRAGRRARGLARDRLAQALATSGRRGARRALG